MLGGWCLVWGGLHAGGVVVSGPGGGLHAGGWLVQGGSGPGGFSLPDPPVNRMTDRCKNITLAKTSFRPVMKP